jgi:hypothetical protein
MAPGYERAMHGLCLGCHRKQEKEVAAADRYLGLCGTCHRDGFTFDPESHGRPSPAIVAATGPRTSESREPRAAGGPPVEGSP